MLELGEKNVYTAVNPARYHISTFNFEKRVSATPDQKVLGTDSVGLKNVYVPLIKEGQHIGSGYIGSRPDIGVGVGAWRESGDWTYNPLAVAGESTRRVVGSQLEGHLPVGIRGITLKSVTGAPAFLFHEAQREGFTRLIGSDADSALDCTGHRQLAYYRKRRSCVRDSAVSTLRHGRRDLQYSDECHLNSGGSANSGQ